jgi:hypothetical protein
LVTIAAGADVNRMIMPCTLDPSKLQPAAINNEAFVAKWASSDQATKDLVARIWSAFENTLLSKPELTDLMEKQVPQVADLFRLWDGSQIKNLSLNLVGIAIAHANAVRVVGLDAPLEIWIK